MKSLNIANKELNTMNENKCPYCRGVKTIFEDYWYEFECVNCHKHFRALQKDADSVIQCPFCKVRPWGFTVSGTKKEHENE